MRIAVVGGGVIGASCARFLAQSGASVTLYTESELTSGASGRSLSWLNASGPWPDHYFHLRMAGIDRYRTLLSQHPDIDWIRFDGGIFCSDEQEIRQWHQAERAHGYDSHLCDADQIAALEPCVNPEALSRKVMVNPGEGWVSLPALIDWLIASFSAYGGELCCNAGKTAPVTGEDGAVRAIKSERYGEVAFDKVVIACGANTPAIVTELGFPLPDGNVLSMVAWSQPQARLPRKVFNTPRVALRPHPGQALAIDHSWYADEIHEDEAGHCTVPESVLTRLFAEADALLNPDAPLQVASYKAGWKPVPADGFPVLGEIPGVPGAWVAYTHSGATLGLIIGELLSLEILSGVHHPMLAAFRPARFQADAVQEK